MDRSTGKGPLWIALIAIAALIIFDQIGQLAVTIFPLRFHTLQWRFGAYGQAIGFISSLLVADLILLVAATALEARGVLRGLGVLHAVLGVALLAVTLVFTLDAVQIRGMVKPELKGSVDFSAFRAAIIGVLTTALLLWMARQAWRLGAASRESNRKLVV